MPAASRAPDEGCRFGGNRLGRAIDVGSTSGNIGLSTLDNVTFTITNEVPDRASLALIGAGVAMIVFPRRRRR